MPIVVSAYLGRPTVDIGQLLFDIAAANNVVLQSGGSYRLSYTFGPDTYVLEVTGSSLTYGSGKLTGGNVTGINLFRNGSSVETLSGMNLPGATAQAVIDGLAAHDPTPLNAALSGEVIDYYGSGEHDSFGGGGLADILRGGGGDDQLFGNGGADTIYGDDGDDFIIGGDGGDVLSGGDGYDVVSYEDSNAGVNITMGGALGAGGTAAGDRIYGFEGLIGSSFNDTLVGDAGDNSLQGNGGADIINGGDGEDEANYFGSSAVQINLLVGTASGGYAQGDQLISIERLAGSSFGDVLVGNAGNNRIEGRGGADQMDGGAGDRDWLEYRESAAGVTVNLTTGIGSGGDAQGDTFTRFEYLGGSRFNDTLIGDGNENAFEGREGADSIDGAGGYDKIFFDGQAAITVNLLTGTGSGGDAQGDTYANIEEVVGTRFADTLIGDNLDNVIQGRQGADTLQGNGGQDSLDYYESDVGVTVSLASGYANGGHATGDVFSGFEDILGSFGADYLEGDSGNNYLEGRDAGDTLIGGAGDDGLNGGSGMDFLVGGAGADFLDGGDDFDYAVYYTAVRADLMSPGSNTGDAAGDGYDGIEGMTGSNDTDTLLGDNNTNFFYGNGGSDYLYGRGGVDYLYGGASADYLYGGAGADVLVGGDGHDFASYDTAVVADLGVPSLNTGEAAGDSFYEIEGLMGSGLGDTLSGDAATNSLYGNGGADVLNGRGGADFLYGGDGDDILNGGLAADRIDGGNGSDLASYEYSAIGITVDLGNASANTGEAVGDTYVSIEGVVGTAFNDTIAGTGAVDSLYGGAGIDQLFGRGGADFLYGGTGNDYIFGDGGSDNIFGGADTDYLYGGAGADMLYGDDGFDYAAYGYATAGVTADLQQSTQNAGEAFGDVYSGIEGLYGSSFADSLRGDGSGNWIWGGAGDDSIYARSGNDYIIGEAGNDFMSGEAGNDTFIFYSGFGQDTISDFIAGAGATDVLQVIIGTAYDTYAELMAVATQVGSSTVLTFDANNTITLQNVSRNSLVADDFRFA